jgi:cytochrome c oxidase accessory protein FixG
MISHLKSWKQSSLLFYPSNNLQLPRIAPKRKLVQWFTSLFVLLTPFVTLNGESLLRLDAATRTLLFFGNKVRIEEFYLFLIVILILVFSFLLVTAVFGRVWCGWLCPQTTFSDIFDFFSHKLQLLRPRFLSRIMEYLSMLMLSFLVASNLIWYFIPPDEFILRLLTGNIGVVAGVGLLSVFLLLFFDLLLVRREFCKSICPYGRIQLMAMNNSTLILEMNPELANSCIRCGACVKSCPMGIDIRNELQIECINCGRCLDACRAVMEKLNKEQGLIHYSFGNKSKGGGLPFNAGSLLLAVIVLVLVALLCFGVANRPTATLSARQSGNAEARKLPDGSLVNFYQAYIENRSARAAVFDLDAAALPGYDISLLGPAKNISVAENANRKIDFAIKITPAPPDSIKLKLRLLLEGKTEAAASVTLLSKQH